MDRWLVDSGSLDSGAYRPPYPLPLPAAYPRAEKPFPSKGLGCRPSSRCGAPRAPCGHRRSCAGNRCGRGGRARRRGCLPVRQAARQAPSPRSRQGGQGRSPPAPCRRSRHSRWAHARRQCTACASTGLAPRESTAAGSDRTPSPTRRISTRSCRSWGGLGGGAAAIGRREARRIAAPQDKGSSPHEVGRGGSAKPRRRGERPTKAPSPSASRPPFRGEPRVSPVLRTPRLWRGRGTQAWIRPAHHIPLPRWPWNLA